MEESENIHVRSASLLGVYFTGVFFSVFEAEADESLAGMGFQVRSLVMNGPIIVTTK